jgi:hypothetical protein
MAVLKGENQQSLLNIAEIKKADCAKLTEKKIKKLRHTNCNRNRK